MLPKMDGIEACLNIKRTVNHFFTEMIFRFDMIAPQYTTVHDVMTRLNGITQYWIYGKSHPMI